MSETRQSGGFEHVQTEHTASRDHDTSNTRTCEDDIVREISSGELLVEFWSHVPTATSTTWERPRRPLRMARMAENRNIVRMN